MVGVSALWPHPLQLVRGVEGVGGGGGAAWEQSSLKNNIEHVTSSCITHSKNCLRIGDSICLRVIPTQKLGCIVVPSVTSTTGHTGNASSLMHGRGMNSNNSSPGGRMAEWKVIKDEPHKVQMRLNQWMYEYWVEVHGVAVAPSGEVVVVVERWRKEGDDEASSHRDR